MDSYKFSVSMCVYGGDNAEHFNIALDSVFNQTLRPDEVVLVVDGPVPEAIDTIIKRYENSHPSFKPVRLEKNVGHGNARRIGMDKCTHELIALMDADDICVPDRFEKQINAFKAHPECSIVGGYIKEFIGSTDNVVGTRAVPIADEDIKQYMKKRCPMNQVTVMFRRADVEKAGGYIDWYCEEDYYLWLRMSLCGMKFCNLTDNLVFVRVGDEMYQRRGGVRYFKSEAKLQGYMLKNKVIGFPRYFINVSERMVLQVLMPNKLRGWVFKRFARQEG